MTEYIDREAAIKLIVEDKVEITPLLCAITKTYTAEQAFDGLNQSCDRHIKFINSIPAADVLPIPDGGIGEVSDGYHTFNGLYYQRMVLFAALVKQNKDKSWKSLRHEDGELCFGGGWFIVGIDTPDGSYTYHYEDNFWSMFDCQELPVAKHWDGHTEKDVTRLLSLPDVQPVKWIPVAERLPEGKDGNYLVAMKTPRGIEVHEAYFFKAWDSYEWYDPVEEYQKYDVTHWMPLPKPPKDGET